MPTHRRTTAIFAALTTLLGGPFAASAAADADGDAENATRGARPALRAAPPAAPDRVRSTPDLATTLGVPADRLAAALRDLRTERRATDVTGARPPIRTAAERAAQRDAYAAALAARLGVARDDVRAALADPGAPARGGGYEQG